MNRYQADINVTVYFDSETECDDMTDEELEVRTMDALHDHQILEWTADDWEFIGPAPTESPSPNGPA